MKILHTGDVHLKEHGDDRWKTLERLIAVGKTERIGLFVISGDLFDKGTSAENLRPKTREIFSGAGFKTVLIPGNHDKDAYGRAMWFGEDMVILTDLNAPFEHDSVRVWGMPFEHIEGERILQKLRSLTKRLTTDKTNILLYHGELLDSFFSRRDFGDEGEERYMPVRLSYFKDLRIDYVLAGHFHSSINSWKLESGGYFVYPGSPTSITKREIGQRKANLFEIGKPPSEYLLDTPHYEEVIIKLDPFSDREPTEVVKECFNNLHEQAKIILTVSGFLNGKVVGMDEKTLVEQLKKIASKRCVEEHYEFKDIQDILEDDLMKRFMDKLEGTELEEKKIRQMRDTAIKAMIGSKP